jgi:hypothetical protein
LSVNQSSTIRLSSLSWRRRLRSQHTGTRAFLSLDEASPSAVGKQRRDKRGQNAAHTGHNLVSSTGRVHRKRSHTKMDAPLISSIALPDANPRAGSRTTSRTPWPSRYAMRNGFAYTENVYSPRSISITACGWYRRVILSMLCALDSYRWLYATFEANNRKSILDTGHGQTQGEAVARWTQHLGVATTI